MKRLCGNWLVPSVPVWQCHPTSLKQSQNYTKKVHNYVPKNNRLLAINGCNYSLFANVVRDLLTDWALAEHQIPDSQFGFCPTRNTNQPLIILRHILATTKKEKGGDVWAPPRGAPWKTLSCAIVHTPGNIRERLRLIRRSNTAALSVVAVAAVITRARL